MRDAQVQSSLQETCQYCAGLLQTLQCCVVLSPKSLIIYTPLPLHVRTTALESHQKGSLLMHSSVVSCPYSACSMAKAAVVVSA